jgi:radical SAM protein with 4Fe4S-binding SPASM domain
MISIKKESCLGCGVCVDICPVTALRLTEKAAVVSADICIDCGICLKKCPWGAIEGNACGGEPLIRDIRFQVTRACNFNCPYCFSNSQRPLDRELSLEEAASMFDELASCGLKTATLTGGEPLLRKDFSLGLLKYLRRKKIYCKLFTNGSLLDKEAIGEFASVADEIQVSLHDNNGADYWRRTSRLLRELKAHRVRTALRITLTSHNYNRTEEMVRFAQWHKVDILRIRPFIAQGRGLRYQGYLMDKDAYNRSIGYLASIRRTRDYPIQLLAPSFPFLYDKNINPDRFIGRGFMGYTLCKCIDDMGAILPDGEVRACGYFPQALGNIRRQRFKDIWSERNPLKRGLKVSCLGRECMDCLYLAICGGGCRANAFVNAASLLAPDPNCPLKGARSKPDTPLSEVREHFCLRAPKYDSSARWVKDAGLLSAIEEWACVESGDCVLDVTCGTGIISKLFFRKAKIVVGVDVTEEMYRQALPKLDYLVNADAQELPFADNQFDLVICRQGLQFMQDPQRAVSEMYRVCRQKGRIMLIHLTAFGEADKEYAFKIQLARQPLRKNCFLEEDLINLLKWAGSVDIRSRSYFTYESINEWVDNGALDLERQTQIKRLYLQAPRGYRQLHQVRFKGDDILDRMKIAIVSGVKR